MTQKPNRRKFDIGKIKDYSWLFTIAIAIAVWINTMTGLPARVTAMENEHKEFAQKISSNITDAKVSAEKIASMAEDIKFIKDWVVRH